ncbi:MAG: hypothetical protein EPN33_06150 [Acidobacteria bacterium]|nr:MAG: hypothetical protein EPN33_06150 [Acidobacteriota bacterium]
MRALIHETRIDILGAHRLPKQAWEPLLDDLKAEYVPGATPDGKRRAVFAAPDGGFDAFIYRMSGQADSEIVGILAKYGIRVEQ